MPYLVFWVSQALEFLWEAFLLPKKSRCQAALYIEGTYIMSMWIMHPQLINTTPFVSMLQQNVIIVLVNKRAFMTSSLTCMTQCYANPYAALICNGTNYGRVKRSVLNAGEGFSRAPLKALSRKQPVKGTGVKSQLVLTAGLPLLHPGLLEPYVLFRHKYCPTAWKILPVPHRHKVHIQPFIQPFPFLDKKVVCK